MAETITWGHALLAAAALAALAALAAASSWLRHRGHGRGTPQYARARTARRQLVYALPAAILLGLIGCLTPLADLPVAG